MNELALFAGAGGGILGGKLLGWRTVCAVEYAEYPREVLAARQNDGCLETFPIWDDVRTFDGKPWRGIVDVVSGGFPCQGISAANPNGKGLDDPRSGLWFEMRRVIGEVQPRFALIENSPEIVDNGGCRIVADLIRMGYVGCHGVLGACSVGAPHPRERMWFVCNAASVRQSKSHKLIRKMSKDRKEHSRTWNGARVDQPGIIGVVDGLACQMDRLKAIGNGQVPAVVRLAWETLTQGLDICP